MSKQVSILTDFKRDLIPRAITSRFVPLYWWCNGYRMAKTGLSLFYDKKYKSCILDRALNSTECYKKYNGSCHKMSDIGICSNYICQFESGLLNRIQCLSILLYQRTVHIIINALGIFYNSFKSSWLSELERCHFPVLCGTLHV